MAKQPNEIWPNNQIVVKKFVRFGKKLYFCSVKIMVYGRAIEIS